MRRHLFLFSDMVGSGERRGEKRREKKRGEERRRKEKRREKKGEEKKRGERKERGEEKREECVNKYRGMSDDRQTMANDRLME